MSRKAWGVLIADYLVKAAAYYQSRCGCGSGCLVQAMAIDRA